MTEITDAPHVLSLMSDYVLELLPVDETDRVSAHLSHCPECRRALETERQVGHLVKSTLHVTSTVESARLRESKPRSPTAAGPPRSLLALSPGLAALGILLLIIGSTLVLYLNQRSSGRSATPPAAYSTAIILTDTPTMTATSEIPATAGPEKMSSLPEDAPGAEDLEQESLLEPAFVPIPAAPLVN